MEEEELRKKFEEQFSKPPFSFNIARFTTPDHFGKYVCHWVESTWVGYKEGFAIGQQTQIEKTN
jgi:hypothetical protein